MLWYSVLCCSSVQSTTHKKALENERKENACPNLCSCFAQWHLSRWIRSLNRYCASRMRQPWLTQWSLDLERPTWKERQEHHNRPVLFALGCLLRHIHLKGWMQVDISKSFWARLALSAGLSTHGKLNKYCLFGLYMKAKQFCLHSFVCMNSKLEIFSVIHGGTKRYVLNTLLCCSWTFFSLQQNHLFTFSIYKSATAVIKHLALFTNLSQVMSCAHSSLSPHRMDAFPATAWDLV